ncbi:hypothetical protein FKP32DRAFT_1594710 [Trametes sanguinea]|nr:hypothetical protein FKP32DRAFT_1594710 [Trametes sanguinea]
MPYADTPEESRSPTTTSPSDRYQTQTGTIARQPGRSHPHGAPRQTTPPRTSDVPFQRLSSDHPIHPSHPAPPRPLAHSVPTPAIGPTKLRAPAFLLRPRVCTRACAPTCSVSPCFAHLTERAVC